MIRNVIILQLLFTISLRTLLFHLNSFQQLYHFYLVSYLRQKDEMPYNLNYPLNHHQIFQDLNYLLNEKNIIRQI
jgi:hypothetical protein